MVKISIIIPVYNADKYIRDCLNSLLSQTFEDIEIICVNDGSVDDSLEILNEYSEKDNRIKVINNLGNIGVTKSRNSGLEISSGEYIFFIDSDDWLGIDFIEKLYRLARKFKVDAVLGAMTLVWKEKSEERLNRLEEGLYTGADGKKSFLNIYDIDSKEQLLKWSIWGNLFKKEKFYRYQLNIDERIKVGEDMAALIPFIMECDSIYVTNNTSYYYRKHGLSTMSSKRSKSMDYYYLWEYLKEYLEDKPEIKRQVAYICCTGIENDYVNLMNLKKQNFYIFPYELIPIHSRIVIFGSGIVGQAYYRQLVINHFCEVKLMVDNNYQENADKTYPVVTPDTIRNTTYDFIIIAVLNKEISNRIYNQLLSDYSVSKDKIITNIPKMITDFIDLG
ncbi:MAG: glycoslytransferase [Firmicutes bacterium]|nr:glycoslytransferase [Bacillota bacterium]